MVKQEFDAIVTTPDLLHHSIEQGAALFEDIALFVVDECHHATGDSGLKKIFVRYNRELLTSRDMFVAPHIIGLTASLVKGKTSAEMSLDMQTKLSLFHAVLIKAEQDREQQITEIPLVASYTKLQYELVQYIDQVRQRLEVSLGHPEISKISQQYAMHQHEYGYRLCALAPEYGQVPLQLVHLWLLHSVAILNEHVGPQEALLFASGDRGLGHCEFWSSHHIDAISAACSANESNALAGKVLCLQSITDIVMPDTKSIVFVDTRWFAELLAITMRSLPAFANAKVSILVGIGSSASQGRKRAELKLHQLRNQLVDNAVMHHNVRHTRAQQFQSIRSFADEPTQGQAHILIATNVAEEGVDITVKNVVRYGMVANARALIQSRGRIREEQGSYFTIEYSSNTRHYAAKKQEAILKHVVDHYQQFQVRDAEVVPAPFPVAAPRSTRTLETMFRTLSITARSTPETMNATAALNQALQQCQMPAIQPETVMQGPSNQPVFTSTIRIGDLETVCAANTKKASINDAARKMLELLRNRP
jgi:ERCC4-related helicase